jgi:prephenate dehydrogenase
MKSLAVVGVGLIGGSVVRAVRAAAPQIRLVGVDPAWRDVSEVLGDTLDQLIDAGDGKAVQAALEAVDLVVLSAPVRVILAELSRTLEYGAVVTDCGSTKREIAGAMAGHPARARFVPGHPMAGFPEGGAVHAKPDLFVGRRWILCPDASSEAARREVEALIQLVGAEPVAMTPEAHDRAVALASHVPQLLGSVLRATATEVGADAVAGPGFASATRVAGGSAAIWGDIFSSNADQICWALKCVTQELEQVVAGLERDPPDTAPALELLARARRARERDG